MNLDINFRTNDNTPANNIKVIFVLRDWFPGKVHSKKGGPTFLFLSDNLRGLLKSILKEKCYKTLANFSEDLFVE